jgi:indole-3-glycerol phosphate synthase/phosphoribosylanthranilate isomerase
VAYESGAIYGGLIFVPTSPRAVNDAQAKAVIDSAPLSYVGVFRNTPVAEVVARAENLSLAAVQLHGSEDQTYIDTLRAELPATVQIWKALSVGETLPPRDLRHVDKYVSTTVRAAPASVSTGRCCRARTCVTSCWQAASAPITV